MLSSSVFVPGVGRCKRSLCPRFSFLLVVSFSLWAQASELGSLSSSHIRLPIANVFRLYASLLAIPPPSASLFLSALVSGCLSRSDPHCLALSHILDASHQPMQSLQCNGSIINRRNKISNLSMNAFYVSPTSFHFSSLFIQSGASNESKTALPRIQSLCRGNPEPPSKEYSYIPKRFSPQARIFFGAKSITKRLDQKWLIGHLRRLTLITYSTYSTYHSTYSI